MVEENGAAPPAHLPRNVKTSTTSVTTGVMSAIASACESFASSPTVSGIGSDARYFGSVAVSKFLTAIKLMTQTHLIIESAKLIGANDSEEKKVGMEGSLHVRTVEGMPPFLRRAPSDSLAEAHPELARENATELLNAYANPLDDANRRDLSEAGVSLLRTAIAAGVSPPFDNLRRIFESRAAKSEEDCHKVCVLLVFDPDRSLGLSRPRGRDDGRLELDYDPARPQWMQQQLKRMPNVILSAQWCEAGFSTIWGTREKSARRGGGSKYCESLCECARRELTEETGIPPARVLELLPAGTRPTRYSRDGGGIFVVFVPTYDGLWELTAYVPRDPLETRAVGVFPICFEREGTKIRHWPHYMANGALRSRAGETTAGIMKSLLHADVISAEEVGLLFELAAREQQRVPSLPTADDLARAKERVLDGARGGAVAPSRLAPRASRPGGGSLAALAARFERSGQSDGGLLAARRGVGGGTSSRGGASGGGHGGRPLGSYRSQRCRNYDGGHGVCSYGDRCTFAHVP